MRSVGVTTQTVEGSLGQRHFLISGDGSSLVPVSGSEFVGIVSQVEEILFRHDPIGIGFADNTDEYRPEAETIVPRLREAKSVVDVRRVVHEEFLRWFAGESTAGPESRYALIADEVWLAWTARRAECE